MLYGLGAELIGGHRAVSCASAETVRSSRSRASSGLAAHEAIDKRRMKTIHDQEREGVADEGQTRTESQDECPDDDEGDDHVRPLSASASARSSTDAALRSATSVEDVIGIRPATGHRSSRSKVTRVSLPVGSCSLG